VNNPEESMQEDIKPDSADKIIERLDCLPSNAPIRDRLELLIGSVGLTHSEDEQVLKHIKKQTDISLPSLRKDLSALTQVHKNQSDFIEHLEECSADSEVATALSKKLQPHIGYDKIDNTWYYQENNLWTEITETDVRIIISNCLKKLLSGGFSNKKLNNIEALLRLNLTIHEWETNRHLLPLQNGVLDTTTNILGEYSSLSKFNWQLPYEFDSKANIDIIDQWLKQATGNDEDKINIIRAFFKIAVTGGELQKFLEVVGQGGTGKSTLVRLLISLLGESNTVSSDLEKLENNSFETAMLYGKKLVIISDPSRYGGSVSVFKALTGGDPIRHEKKHRQQQNSFIFNGVVIIPSNEPIQSTDDTSGLGRRRLPLIFNIKITDKDIAKWESVGGIESQMQKELPGLLNWVLSMPDSEVNKAIKNIESGVSKDEREHYCKTNKVAEWMDERLVLRESCKIFNGSSTDKLKPAKADRLIKEKLYPNYEDWCVRNKIHPLSVQPFVTTVEDICKHLKLPVQKMPKSNQGISFTGLGIRREVDLDPTIITLQNLTQSDE
jgi:putative DNA primase/helicase